MFIPNNGVLLVVGDFDSESLTAQIEDLFAQWPQGPIPQLSSPALPQRSERTIYLVDRPGSAQSNIVIVNEAITRTSPDYFPLLLMHTILGANASSRLFMNLREHKGYTYGAYSNLDARKLAGTFRATAEVRTAVTGASLHEFFYELDRIRNEAVSQEEITNAKSYLTGVFPIRIETQDGLIDQLVNNKMFGLPDDYLRTYRERVSAVTTDEILAVAEKYVTPDSAAIVIVGDAAEINEQIKPYSEKIEVYDTDGDRK
jgi:zinc protease